MTDEGATPPADVGRDRRIAIVAVLGVLVVCALVLVSTCRGGGDGDAAKAQGSGGVAAEHAPAQPPSPPPVQEAGPPAQGAVAETGPALGAPTVTALFDPTSKPPAPSPSQPGGCVKESNKELCNDGRDNNCNGQIDEGCPRR